MATFEQARDRFTIKAEKNATNDGISTDKGRFCTMFNEAENKFLTLHLQQRGIDDIRYIQKFLVLDKSIPPTTNSKDKYNFKNPENYFDFSSVRPKAKKGECARFIDTEEIQTENLNEVLQDEYRKPSFEWGFTPYTVNADQLSFYTDNFEISEILLNYYRYPNQIRLVDPDDPESDFDETYPIEWDDKSLDDIITLMVFNLDINQNNARYQLQTIRAQK